jgi:hypothetical protein
VLGLNCKCLQSLAGAWKTYLPACLGERNSRDESIVKISDIDEEVV